MSNCPGRSSCSLCLAKACLSFDSKVYTVIWEVISPIQANVKTQVVIGDPKEKICEVAENLHADLLVMGCRAFGPIKRLFSPGHVFAFNYMFAHLYRSSCDIKNHILISVFSVIVAIQNSLLFGLRLLSTGYPMCTIKHATSHPCLLSTSELVQSPYYSANL